LFVCVSASVQSLAQSCHLNKSELFASAGVVSVL